VPLGGPSSYHKLWAAWDACRQDLGMDRPAIETALPADPPLTPADIAR
jgi:hypothetical protein